MNASLRPGAAEQTERPTERRLNRFRHASLLAVTKGPISLYAMGFMSFFLFGLVQAGYGPSYPLFGLLTDIVRDPPATRRRFEDYLASL